MEPGPKIRGRKTKSIRVDPSDLKLLREELKGDPAWAEYAAASDSEIVRLAVMFARLHIQPDMYVMTLETVNTIVDEAVRINIAEVALVLGGVAQMDRDGMISVTRPESDSIKTFKAKPVAKPAAKNKPTFIH